MDDAARARDAALDAVADIEPARLRALIETRLQDAPMAPAVLARLAARATGREAPPEALDRRATGVQLIYDGLDITRELARRPPWRDADGEARVRADLDVLAADVLVARGFRLLARTEAAWTAVETVRAFGRDETTHAGGGPDPGQYALEADVFELAIVAGTSAAGADPPAGARPFAVELAASIDADGTGELLSEPAVEALSDLVAEGPSTRRPGRIWAGSSER